MCIRPPALNSGIPSKLGADSSGTANVSWSRLPSGSLINDWIWSLSWDGWENKSMLSCDNRSVAVARAEFTFDIAEASNSTSTSNSSRSASCRSSTFWPARSIICFNSSRFDNCSEDTNSPFWLLVSTTSAKASRATSNATFVAISIPSITVAIAVMVAIIWWEAISTARASVWSTELANGLNWVGSISLGNPKTSTNFSLLRSVSTSKVVKGDTTKEPTGDFRVTSANIWPEDVSTVCSSVITVKDISGLAEFMVKAPSVSVLVFGSPGFRRPSAL